MPDQRRHAPLAGLIALRGDVGAVAVPQELMASPLAGVFTDDGEIAVVRALGPAACAFGARQLAVEVAFGAVAGVAPRGGYGAHEWRVRLSHRVRLRRGHRGETEDAGGERKAAGANDPTDLMHGEPRGICCDRWEGSPAPNPTVISANDSGWLHRHHARADRRT